MSISVRKAEEKDCDNVSWLLANIAELHQKERPDIYKSGSQKYSHNELVSIFNDKDRPVFVAVDENDKAIGHCFCIISIIKGNGAMHDYSSLYIDDFCISEQVRGQGVGKVLLEAVKNYAKAKGFSVMDLNVWEFNDSAIKFYESCGFTTQRRRMEINLNS